ncbi:FAD-dependent oxidoreductase [Actinokineospora diospyrosa]|uniref:FAD dependent oxidoreductase n=1 Tax=Actinokineospora diospyrosa TaxID=103728 RepID=A0ABT1IMF6_9PSEU|nr:FAD-dependent oxidoreductase [Actinokineospora diospyrosa]MCP2273854.1 FAD dependent oxidoreductase [Actinokineospora diospyrosa]
MRVCVVGSGIAGLSAAHYLTDHPGVSVTLLEAAEQFGGRANVTADGEHCTRLFLADYHHLLALFREIPAIDGTVLDSLRRCRRFASRDNGSWVEIDHIYASLAKTPGLSMKDKRSIARANRRAFLVARRSAQSATAFGSIWNWTPSSLARAVASSRRERIAYALPGSTDRHLTTPWTALLSERGVRLRTRSRVESVAPVGGGVQVTTTSGNETFDAVVFTGFAHDAYALLDRSGIPRRLDNRTHIHCVAFTIDLDPREEVLTDKDVRVYAGAGITTVVQPAEHRCVALAAFPRSTGTEFVLNTIRDQLRLEHEPRRVRVRSNTAPSEAVFIGEYIDPVALEEPLRGRVYFAGSHTHNTYPVDSAEGACRSAFYAVERLARDHPTVVPRSRLGLPEVSSERVVPALAHPNGSARPRLRGALRAVATRSAKLVAPVVADLSFERAPGERWPADRPAVYVANHRSVFDVPAGLLTFDRLGVSPVLVVAEKYFTKGYRKALLAFGAIPAIRRSTATVTAGVAAIAAGESVAIMPEGRITHPAEAATSTHGLGAVEIAIAAGVPIVPIVADGTHLVWPGARPWPLVRLVRPRVTIKIGAPIHPAGRTGQELAADVRAAISELTAVGAPRVSLERDPAVA